MTPQQDPAQIVSFTQEDLATKQRAFCKHYKLPAPGYTDVMIASTSFVSYSVLNSSRSIGNESSRIFRAYGKEQDGRLRQISF